MRRFGGGERRYDKRAEQDDEEDMWREMLVNTHELLRDGHRRLREVMSTIAAFREQRAREEEQELPHPRGGVRRRGISPP